MKNFLVPLFLLLLICPLPAGNPVSVPLGSSVYRFLDRMETQGILENIRDGVKPFDRERISELLQEVDGQRTALTAIDRARLDNYLLDFRYEIEFKQKYHQTEDNGTWYSPFMSFNQLKNDFSRFFQQNQPEEENHLILWEDSTNSFYLDFLYGFNYYERSDDVYRRSQSQTFRFRGSIWENLGYLLQVSFYQINGSEGYRDEDPELKNTWFNFRADQDVIYFDRSGGDLAYRSEFLDFRLAYQPTTWGPGESGQLILSDHVEQYPYISLSKHWSWGSFTYMHGKLLALASGDSIDGQPVYPDKWIVSNRFEFSPWHMMSIGLSGMILYGNRYLEWGYLIPFNYLRATEHNLRDRDNALLALDVEARIASGVKVYGTLLLDELNKSKLGTDWYGNKHGFQIGTHFTDPFRLPNLSLRIEYVAIMPWVYTHKYTINRYLNDGISLGHWAGPNSEVIYLHLEKDWHQRLRMGLLFRQWKHGENYPNENIGGDILLGHNVLLGDQKEARTTRKFLEGLLYTDKRIEFYTQYEVLNDLFLNLAITRINLRGPETTDDRDLTEIHFGFQLDY